MEQPADDVEGRRLRPRRGALADISNRFVSTITDVAKKVTRNTRKRKLSDSTVEDRRSSVSSKADSPEVDVSNEETSSIGDAASSNSIENVNPVIDEVAEQPRKIIRSLPLHKKNADPAQCYEILDAMYEIHYEQQENYTPKPYMTKQNDINPKMRAILIDWLVEVHYKFKLQTATLWLAINILDRYLETTVIVRSKLQLIGVTALLIACKFEEIYPPEVRDCVYITDYAYEREEVLQTESDILLKLNYQLLVPTGYHFMARYLNCIRASERTRTLAGYYSERNLQEIDTLLYKPHMFAASCICAALTQQAQDLDDCNSPPVWNRTLEEESGLKLEDIIECTKTLVKHVSEEPQTTSKRKLIAAKKKYSAEKYQNASSLPLPIFVEL